MCGNLQKETKIKLDNIEEALDEEEVTHFPAEDRCLGCHDAHGSTVRALLVDRVMTICASCHEDSAARLHPVVNHPVDTVIKPSKPVKQLDCASCHLPHASPLPKLMGVSRSELCKQCHNY